MTNVAGNGDSSGFDLALLVSTRPHERLEIFGAFKVAFDSLKNSDYNYSRAYLVPGIEYRISSDIDLLAEFGFGLNGQCQQLCQLRPGILLFALMRNRPGWRPMSEADVELWSQAESNRHLNLAKVAFSH